MNITMNISNNTDNELIKAQNENLILKAEIKRLSQQQNELLNRSILDHEQTIIDHERIIVEHDQIIIDHERTIRDLRAENIALKCEISELKDEIRDLKGEIGNLKKKNIVLDDEIGDLKGENSDLKKKNIFLDDEISDLKKKNIVLDDEISDLKKKNIVLDDEISDLKGENSDLKKKNIVLDDEIIDLKGEISDLKKKNIVLVDEINDLKNYNKKKERKEYIQKLYMTINDSNACFKLENKYHSNGNKSLALALNNLRQERNCDIHFLLYEENRIKDSERVFQAKINYLIKTFNNLSEMFREALNDVHPALIDELLKELVYKEIVPELTKDEQRKVIRFWDW